MASGGTVPALSSIAGSLVYLVAMMVFLQMGLTALDYQQKYGDNNWVYGLLLGYVGVGVVLVFRTWRRWLRRDEKRDMDARHSARAISLSILFSMIAFNAVIFQDANLFHTDSAPVWAISANVLSMLWLAWPFTVMLTTIPLRTNEDEWGESRLGRKRRGEHSTQDLDGPEPHPETGDRSPHPVAPDAPDISETSPEAVV